MIACSCEVLASDGQKEFKAFLSGRKIGPGNAHPGIVAAVVFTPQTDRPTAVREWSNLVSSGRCPSFGLDYSESFRGTAGRLPYCLNPLPKRSLPGGHVVSRCEQTGVHPSVP